MKARAESFSTLPREISLTRFREKSAGAVLAKKPWKQGEAEGLKNQETGHFKHLCGLARSILAWVSVATAATTRPTAT
ncbi:hypothetical protein [Nitrosomonas sp. Nm34]|uniref:hypothetical protein n=1 Tax=Nitrosomonas sp. Nm34 TaxID=1881055 RepID=UPI000B85DB24|nr:hypothetical protein [Nitrosomonas sp. Nm34]